jgi:beta-carotene 3-hydroxylase
LWNWHRDHHNHHNNLFEINDLFTVSFAITAISLTGTGVTFPEVYFLTWIGLGVTLYGFFYFVFYDIIVHRLVNMKVDTSGRYMQRIMRAHCIHHKIHSKEGAEAFEFLYAPEKYDRPAKEKRAETQASQY